MSTKPLAPPPYPTQQADTAPAAGISDELGPRSRALLMQRIQESNLKAKAATKELESKNYEIRSLEFQLAAAEQEHLRAKQGYQELLKHYQQGQAELGACAKALESAKESLTSSISARAALEGELRMRVQEERRLADANRELRDVVEELKARIEQDRLGPSQLEREKAKAESAQLAETRIQNEDLSGKLTDALQRIQKLEAKQLRAKREHEFAVESLTSRHKLELERLSQTHSLELERAVFQALTADPHRVRES